MRLTAVAGNALQTSSLHLRISNRIASGKAHIIIIILNHDLHPICFPPCPRRAQQRAFSSPLQPPVSSSIIPQRCLCCRKAPQYTNISFSNALSRRHQTRTARPGSHILSSINTLTLRPHDPIPPLFRSLHIPHLST